MTQHCQLLFLQSLPSPIPSETEISKPTTCMCAILFQIKYWLNPKWYKSVLKFSESFSCFNWHKITALFKQQKYFKTSILLSLCLGQAVHIQRQKAQVEGFREVGCTKPVDLVQQMFIYSTVVVHIHFLKYKSSLHEAGMFPKVFGRTTDMLQLEISCYSAVCAFA